MPDDVVEVFNICCLLFVVFDLLSPFFKTRGSLLFTDGRWKMAKSNAGFDFDLFTCCYYYYFIDKFYAFKILPHRHLKSTLHDLVVFLVACEL